MSNVQRINRGPHPTPRPGDKRVERTPGGFQELPVGLKGRIVLGVVGVGLVLGGTVAAVRALGSADAGSIDKQLHKTEQVCDQREAIDDMTDAGLTQEAAEARAEKDQLNCTTERLAGNGNSTGR